jgi:tetratricopeptide (TPR) repeat protein
VSKQPQSAGYPGNLSLPVEVREKILSTFHHTLDLYHDGKLDDCLIGCDFILKMDPRFAPARKLQEKARNPTADVDVAELEAVASPPASPAPAPRGRETGTVSVPRRDTGSLDSTAPPAPSLPVDESAVHPVEGLEELSLESISLEGPLPHLATSTSAAEPGIPFEQSAHEVGSPFAGLSQGPLAADPDLAAETPSPEKEITALLKQGDEARAAGDKQQAIEVWSRIFLIDIDNGEAIGRIENARREMAEESRQLAAAMEKGQESFAKGDLAAAKTHFDALLALDDTSPPPGAPTSPPPAEVVLGPSPHDLSRVAVPGDVLAEELEQSGARRWTVTPRPTGEAPADVELPKAVVGKRLKIPLNSRTLVLAAAVVAAILLAAFFLLRSPRKGSETAPAETGSSLEHATQLFREGKIAETTEELRRIPREHPDYARAQKLLASLGAHEEAAVPPSPESPPVAGGSSSSDPAALRADAEKALAEKRYIDALKSFSLAAPHFQGDPTFSQEMAAASEKVSELTAAVKLYNDGEYETAIPLLWRIYQASRDNQDARSYLLRSYYNEGIAELQNGLFDKAKASFSEVLALDPEDLDAARHRQFADRYHNGDLDLLGRIYVRYISPRP